ncbi:hypothetical protein OG824_18710 [Streptomyces prunicolor]|uniref:hypothetical protein n=1 Tax=Streptomyces prunicolor TaxID=67348 RepID=UPI00225BF2DB|nr:hypothetical protein [Streptomyces prunicolor]MCX5237234.1 hypothetical protein [Streptomyces prunicolor]
MDAADWIAISATTVSVFAGVFSWSQARSAKESALYAQRQTVAAEEQLRLARDQFAAETADRHEANGPEFELEPGSIYYDEQRFAKMTLRQIAGPALRSIVVSHPDDHDQLSGLDGRELGPSSPGAPIRVECDAEYNMPTPITVSLTLTCTGRQGETWVRGVGCLLDSEPDPEPSRRTRGRRS